MKKKKKRNCSKITHGLNSSSGCQPRPVIQHVYDDGAILTLGTGNF